MYMFCQPVGVLWIEVKEADLLPPERRSGSEQTEYLMLPIYAEPLAYIRSLYKTSSNPVVLDWRVNFAGSSSLRFSMAAEEAAVAKAAVRMLIMENFILYS